MNEKKIPLAAALRYLAEQDRLALESHPTPRELASYHAGDLPPEAETSLREHLAACHVCGNLLLDLAGFADLAPPPGVPELTDDEVEHDWQALRGRMTTKESGEWSAPVVPFRPAAVVAPRGRTFSPWWTAIAAMLLAVVGFSWGEYERWHSPDASIVPRIDAGDTMRGGPEVNLPAISSRRGGEVILDVESQGVNYPRYEAEVTDLGKPNGRVFLRAAAETKDITQESFFIKPGALEPGKYSLYLYGLGKVRDRVWQFDFSVNAP